MNLKIGIVVMIVGMAILAFIASAEAAYTILPPHAYCETMRPITTHFPGGYQIVWAHEGRSCISSLRGCVQRTVGLTASTTSYLSRRCSGDKEVEYLWLLI